MFPTDLYQVYFKKLQQSFKFTFLQWAVKLEITSSNFQNGPSSLHQFPMRYESINISNLHEELLEQITKTQVRM